MGIGKSKSGSSGSGEQSKHDARVQQEENDRRKAGDQPVVNYLRGKGLPAKGEAASNARVSKDEATSSSRTSKDDSASKSRTSKDDRRKK